MSSCDDEPQDCPLCGKGFYNGHRCFHCGYTEEQDQMAKTETKLAKTSNTALARPMEDWEAKLAQEAKAEVAKEAVGLPRITKEANEILIDGNPVKDNKLRCVIVEYIFTHTYFKNKYEEGKSGSPDCYAYGESDTGLVPQAGCRDKQSDQCDGCPHNVFKTAENGKGKRCPGGRRLAVVIPGADPASMSLVEIRSLTLNSGSLKNWGAFMRSVQDVTPSGNVRAVMTEITTEKKGQVFVWALKPVERLSPEMGPKLAALRERAKEALMLPWPDVGEEEKAEKPAQRRKVKGQ